MSAAPYTQLNLARSVMARERERDLRMGTTNAYHSEPHPVPSPCGASQLPGSRTRQCAAGQPDNAVAAGFPDRAPQVLRRPQLGSQALASPRYPRRLRRPPERGQTRGPEIRALARLVERPLAAHRPHQTALIPRWALSRVEPRGSSWSRSRCPAKAVRRRWQSDRRSLWLLPRT